MQFRLKPAAILGAMLWTAAPALAAEMTNSGAAKPAAAWGDLFDDPVVARGKGVEIRRSQLDNAFIAYKTDLSIRGERLPEGLRSTREAELLDRLVLNQLIVNRATDPDRTRGKEIADKFLAELKKGFASDETFARRLKVMGLTQEQHDKLVQHQALADAVIEREVKAGITITDAQVQEFYTNGVDVLVRTIEATVEKMAKDPETRLDQLTGAKKRIEEIKKANLAGLERPEAVRVLLLFLARRDRDKDEPYPEEQQRAKRQLAEKLLARAKAGEDFAKLVTDYSEDRRLKETKGEYTFSRNATFAPEFKAAAFSLQTNQLSDVVVNPYGFHLIKLLEKTPARKLEFDKAAPEIRDFLRSQELQKRLPAFFEKVRSEGKVEILDARYQIKPDTEPKPARPNAL